MFRTKQYNTRNAFKATLNEANGSPVDLTGATVRFFMASRAGVTMINRQMQVGANGEVLIVFDPVDVAEPGIFNAEIIVEYSDGRKEIHPNEGYIRVYIESSIGGGQ